MSGEQQGADGRAGERMTAEERRMAVLGALDAEEWRTAREIATLTGLGIAQVNRELQSFRRRPRLAAWRVARIKSRSPRPRRDDIFVYVWRRAPETPAGLAELERLKEAGA